MNYAMNLALEMTGVVILLLMYFNFGNRRYLPWRPAFDDKLFRLMLLINIALLTFDMLSWICNGSVWPGVRPGNILSNHIYFMLQPAMCLTWVLYCEYKLTENLPLLSHRLLAYSLPAVISEIMVIWNLFSPILFRISEENIYSRGNGFYILYTALMLFYILFAFCRVVVASRSEAGRKARYKDSYYFLMLYPLFPCIGLLVQSLFYGVAVIWTGSMISLLILYCNLQNAQITTDTLTGLNNRHRFQSYISYKLNSRNPSGILYILMIDIDHFKAINDRFGHLAGDEALRVVSRIILKCVRRSDFVARIGGDEFTVIGERTSMEEIQKTVQAMEAEFIAYNKKHRVPYEVSASVGCSTLTGNENKDADMLMAEADRMMYARKHIHHAAQKLQAAGKNAGV